MVMVKALFHWTLLHLFQLLKSCYCWCSEHFKDFILLPPPPSKVCSSHSHPQFLCFFSLSFPLGSFFFFYKVAALYCSPLLSYHLPSVTTQLGIDWRKKVRAGIVSSHFLPSPRKPRELIHILLTSLQPSLLSSKHQSKTIEQHVAACRERKHVVPKPHYHYDIWCPRQ